MKKIRKPVFVRLAAWAPRWCGVNSLTKLPAVHLVLDPVVGEMNVVIEVRQIVFARPVPDLVLVAACVSLRRSGAWSLGTESSALSATEYRFSPVHQHCEGRTADRELLLGVYASAPGKARSRWIIYAVCHLRIRQVSAEGSRRLQIFGREPRLRR